MDGNTVKNFDEEEPIMNSSLQNFSSNNNSKIGLVKSNTYMNTIFSKLNKAEKDKSISNKSFKEDEIVPRDKIRNSVIDSKEGSNYSRSVINNEHEIISRKLMKREKIVFNAN